jgi:methionyl-tRNA formyltransferase
MSRVVDGVRVVFMGSPDFAVPSLRAVHSRYPVVMVVTQPDRPQGRGQKLLPPPVKLAAIELGLQVMQPEKLRVASVREQIAALEADLFVVAAYGKILSPKMLAVPRLGCINVHASLLPRWRGASPVHRAVMAGDTETGISIMRVVRELDAGPVFAVCRRPIRPDETSEEVERDLAVLGAGLLVEVVDAMEAGTARETLQDERGVSYAPRLTKGEGLIEWSAPAGAIHNQVRGLHPWPHAYTFLGQARVIVLRSAREDGPALTGVAPGEVVAVDESGVTVAGGDGQSLRLVHLQLEGRRPVSGREFAAGARLKPGRRFGVWPQ